MKTLNYKFVKNIPEKLAENTLFISIDYCTAIHKCFCGCGNEVVTPLSPSNWELIFDGETVSLFPSIGNWSLDCKSHYWIKKNKVVWAKKWSEEQISFSREVDRKDITEFYYNKKTNKFRIIFKLKEKFRNWKI